MRRSSDRRTVRCPRRRAPRPRPSTRPWWPRRLATTCQLGWAPTNAGACCVEFETTSSGEPPRCVLVWVSTREARAAPAGSHPADAVVWSRGLQLVAELGGAFDDPDQDAVGGGEVIRVEGAVEAGGRRVDRVGQVRVEGVALGRELGGAGTVGVAAAGGQPLRFELAQQGGDAGQAEVELRLAGEVDVEVAG